MLHYIILMIIILITGSVILLQGCKKTPSTNSNNYSIVDESGFITKKKIVRKLESLKNEPVMNGHKMGAMCYKPAPPKTTASYTCPSCSEKTLYAYDYSEKSKNRKENEIAVRAINRDLQVWRREIVKIKDIQIKLDESRLCKQCKKEENDSPDLGLIICYEDNRNMHKIYGITAEDAVLLSEFFSGKKIHKGERDSQTPLKKYIHRIKELLGI